MGESAQHLAFLTAATTGCAGTSASQETQQPFLSSRAAEREAEEAWTLKGENEPKV